MEKILYPLCYKSIGSYIYVRGFWRRKINHVFAKINKKYENNWNGKFHMNPLLPIFVYKNDNHIIRIHQCDPSELYAKSIFNENHYITAYLNVNEEDNSTELIIALILTDNNLILSLDLIRKYILDDKQGLNESIREIYSKQIQEG